MSTFQSIVRDIKDIKIQGAQNVARAALKAIGILAEDYKHKPRNEFLNYLKNAKHILIKTRPTEPAMRNVLNYLLHNFSEDDIYNQIVKRNYYIENHFERIDGVISSIGSKKIKSGDIVFTHCHSSTVIHILKKAHSEKKRFIVYNTETRPLFQGRITAREIAREGIPVVHFVDSAARIAIKEADIMMIGADAISSEGNVYNKVGSEMFAEISNKYDVPVYVCTDSWKFDPKSVFGFEEEIEKRSSKEIWPMAPKGVTVDNRAFEKVDPNLITGIISELGVYNPQVFVEEVKQTYPWMF